MKIGEKIKKEKVVEVGISDRRVSDMAEDYLEMRLFDLYFNKVIKEMSLVYLIALFEDFIKSTLAITFKICPNALKSSKTLTYEEIIGYLSLGELKDAIIEKEIENVMYGDIDAVAKYISGTFKFDMDKTKDWGLLRERFYRRNVIIHNKCFPSQTYKDKTNYKGEDVLLNISEKYLETSIELLESLAFEICLHFTGKFTEQNITPEATTK